MKILIFLTILCLLPIAVQADTITFNLTSATVGNTTYLPAQANGEWMLIDNYRIKLVSNGMIDQYDPDNLGLFWAAMVTPFDGTNREIAVAITGTFCVDNSCALYTMTGTIETSVYGMRWKQPPVPTDLKGYDGRVFTLSTHFNQPGGLTGRGWQATIDIDVSGRIATTIFNPTPVPEPSVLILLGTGLTMMARRLKKKTI